MFRAQTPVSLVEAPRTGITQTGSGQPAVALVTTGDRSYLTLCPTITANGVKLRMAAVIKGKTPRTLKKITSGAIEVSNKVQLYYSETGKMNTGVMLLFLREIIAPYTAGRSAAILLDAYSSHHSDEVVEQAEKLNLQIIQVPKCLTSTLQPLDVNFNGPMAAVRTKIWREMKRMDPEYKDSAQHSVERAQRAYEAMSPEQVRAGWQEAFLVD